MATPGINLAGLVKDIFGNPHAGSLTVQLVGYGSQAPRVPGTAMIDLTAPIEVECVGGAYNFNLWGNDQITPGNTYYTVLVKDADGNAIQMNAYQFSGTHSYDLSNLDPYIPIPVAPANPNAVLLNPPGAATQTITGSIIIDGNLTVTGITSFNFGLYNVPCNPTVQFNGLFGYGQTLTLNQTVFSSAAANFPAGFPLPFFIKQDAAGNHPFVWPPNFINPPQINPAPNGVTTQTWARDINGNYYPFGAATWS